MLHNLYHGIQHHFYGLVPWDSTPLNQHHLGRLCLEQFFPSTEEYEDLRKRGAADNIDGGKTLDSWVDQMTLIFFSG